LVFRTAEYDLQFITNQSLFEASRPIGVPRAFGRIHLSAARPIMHPSSKTWIVRLRPIASPRIRLLCFPHGGGSASTFHRWVTGLPKEVEICAIEFPGRGRRLLETPPVSIEEIVVALTERFHPYQDIPFALFGHSLGALVSFELARRLRAMNIQPVHLFVSGRAAPQLPDPETPIRHLPIPEFVEAVRDRYQGIPDEILHDAEMIDLLLPALRADIAMNETYQYADGPLLECPISAFGGHQDRSVTTKELAAWRDQTSGAFRLRMFPGDHFFIHSAREAFLRAVAEDLDSSLPPPTRTSF
jgi:medium-chain acyl-[acyl-carrier-protein] hydrolase